MSFTVIENAIINFIAGFAVAAMLAIWGVPREVLLALQIALVLVSFLIIVRAKRRARR